MFLEGALRLITEEIQQLDEKGVKIATALHPKGRNVRARLNMIVANSPVGAKTVDVHGNRRTRSICTYCPTPTDQFGTRELWKDEPSESWPSQTPAQAKAMASNTVSQRLRYFSRKINSPPDPMHTVYVGICGRCFWHLFLIEGCDNLGKKLNEAQNVMARAILPSSIKRPDIWTGLASGGTPSAEECVTLFRCLLPFVMLQLWRKTLRQDEDEHINFEPKGLTEESELKPGRKSVKAIFEPGLLLCCIVDMLESEFSEDDVQRLHKYIVRYNSKAASLLGKGWIVLSNHMAEHIPDAIRAFGAPKNFSSLRFERQNQVLSKIKTSGYKRGQIELTMMRKVVSRSDLQHLLSQSNDTLFRETILGYIKSRNEWQELPPSTRLTKTTMEDDTYGLLRTYLNGPGKCFPGRFVEPHDVSASSSDVVLQKDAIFLRSVTQNVYATELRFSGYAAEGRKNKGNCFGMVKLEDQSVQAVKILWLFEQTLQFNGPGTAAVSERFMHVRKLKMLSRHEAFGYQVACGELLDEMNIHFASLHEYCEDMVVPVGAMVSQLVLVPILTHGQQHTQIYGLKQL